MNLDRMNLVRALALTAVGALAIGCAARYKDVSATETYKPIIGAVCRVVRPLNAYGVTLKLEREQKTDFVALSHLNLSGPEFTFSTYLSVGTQMQVLAVRQCMNCPFETRIEYQVNVTPKPTQFARTPVYLRAEPMRSGQVACGLTGASSGTRENPRAP